jgi:hypothetical protein
MKLHFTVLLLLLSASISAQALLFEVNSTGAGRNVGVQWEKSWSKNTFGVGVGCNINKIAHSDDQFNLYRKRLYATKAVHFINLHLTYDRAILPSLPSHIKPFLFFDVQAKYSGTRNRFFLPYSYDSTATWLKPEDGIRYKEYINFYGPFLWVEPNVGIGFRAMLSQRFYLKQQVGVGVLLTFGSDDQITYRQFTPFDWEFAGLIQVGLGWKFLPKEE